MSDKEQFGKYIKNARLKAGYEKISYLAKVSGIPQSTISRLESGQQSPSLETLRKLAPALDISYDALLIIAGYVTADDYKTKISAINIATEIKRQENEGRSPDIRKIIRGGDKLNSDQQAQLLKVAQALFPEAFQEDE